MGGKENREGRNEYQNNRKRPEQSHPQGRQEAGSTPYNYQNPNTSEPKETTYETFKNPLSLIPTQIIYKEASKGNEL